MKENYRAKFKKKYNIDFYNIIIINRFILY